MDPSLSATGPSIHPFPPTGPSDPSIPSSLSSTPSPSHSHFQFQTGGPLIEPHQDLDTFLGSFWTRQMEVVEREERDGKNASLPLARIKKVMKSNGEVKVGSLFTLSPLRIPAILCPLLTRSSRDYVV